MTAFIDVTRRAPDLAAITRKPSILPAAQAADRMAAHLEASFNRVGNLDVVARREVEGAIHELDRMFAIETLRFAYFHEDPEDFDDAAPIGCELTEIQSEAIAELFSDPDLSVISSFLNMDNQALAESLEFGLAEIDWEGEGRTGRELLIEETGDKLPVAYLSNAFERAALRLQSVLQRRAGLSRAQAISASSDIKRSVAIETVRAGCLSGERLETLASWLLTIERPTAGLLIRLLTRGSTLFLMTLLSVASEVPEKRIRESAWDPEAGGIHDACKRIGLTNGMADFLLETLKQSHQFGHTQSASDIAGICGEMATWINLQADRSQAPLPVIEAALTISDWEDWDLPEMTQGATPTAEIIDFPLAS